MKRNLEYNYDRVSILQSMVVDRILCSRTPIAVFKVDLVDRISIKSAYQCCFAFELKKSNDRRFMGVFTENTVRDFLAKAK